jgi:CheY-like chemotaxis protein
VARTDADGDAVIEVHDTGEGIRPEVRARIFDPFFTTKPVGVGTGLGLSISHGIIAALGGEITVESEVGKGSVFRVALPAMRDAWRSEAPRPPRPSVRRARILVVDDEEMICVTLTRILSHAHEVHTLTRAREALERLLRGDEKYDVVLCDLMMPDLSGMELYEALKREAPEQIDRIVFLTGGAFTPRAQAFTTQVPNLFVEKPFEAEKLLDLIASRVAALSTV